MKDNSWKIALWVVVLFYVFMFAIIGVIDKNESTYKSYTQSYDYDKGYGYTAPKSGESFSDYVKRQDPDLYDAISERWNSLK